MVSEYQVLEVIVMRLIELRKLREVIKFIRELLQMDISESRCQVIYPIIYVIQISNEMNSDCWSEILRCICYYFYEPVKILDIIEHLVTNNLSNEERKMFLRGKSAEGKKLSKGYSLTNNLFTADVLSVINTPSANYDLIPNIESTNTRLDNTKEEFMTNKSYSLMLRILCNDPYVLAKYLYIYRH